MSDDRPSNRMLADLSDGTRLLWQAHLEWVNLPAGQELHAQGTAASSLHFPTTALVALTIPAANSKEVAVALVGNDGCLGMGALMGHLPEAARAVVLHPGAAWRLPVGALSAGGPDPVQVTRVLLEHLHALTNQMTQTALCQRMHGVEQRLCRWLLVAFNRVPDDALSLDLDGLSEHLDVPVDALAGAVARLVEAGALSCSAGGLRLLDRSVLKARGCGCHDTDQSSRGM